MIGFLCGSMYGITPYKSMIVIGLVKMITTNGHNIPVTMMAIRTVMTSGARKASAHFR